MIRTFFEPDPKNLARAGLPIIFAQPKVLAIVRIPRFQPPLENLEYHHVVSFLIDTGADTTSIALRDALFLFEPRRFAEIKRTQKAEGIGGIRVLYAQEPAEIYLLHTDSKATKVSLELDIERPPDAMIKGNKVDPPLLSGGVALLGRDILEFFKLEIEYDRTMSYLRLWAKGTELIDLRPRARTRLSSP